MDWITDVQERTDDLIDTGKYYLDHDIDIEKVLEMLKKETCIGGKYWWRLEKELREYYASNDHIFIKDT